MFENSAPFIMDDLSWNNSNQSILLIGILIHRFVDF